MWVCPICTSSISDKNEACNVCGYEKFADYVKYNTIMPVPDPDILFQKNVKLRYQLTQEVQQLKQ